MSKKKNETFIDFFMIPEETFDNENIQKKLVVEGTEGWGEGGARRTGWGDGDGNGEGEGEGGGGRRIGWGDGMDFGWENGRSCFCFCLQIWALDQSRGWTLGQNREFQKILQIIEMFFRLFLYYILRV